MRRKSRGTLQVNGDVKGLFMLAKPIDMTTSDFLKGLLLPTLKTSARHMSARKSTRVWPP